MEKLSNMMSRDTFIEEGMEVNQKKLNTVISRDEFLNEDLAGQYDLQQPIEQFDKSKVKIDLDKGLVKKFEEFIQ